MIKYLMVACACVALPLEVHAAWQRAGGTPGLFLRDVASADGQTVWMVGIEINPGNFSAPYTRRVRRSTDGGFNTVDVSGVIDDSAGFLILDAAFAWDASIAWVGGGNEVYRTLTAGAGAWAKGVTNGTVRDLHFFDPLRGVLVGSSGNIETTSDGGTSWSPAISPTSVDLRTMHWFSESHGWAIGYNEREESFGGPTQYYDEDAVLLRTVDGGQTWQVTELGDRQVHDVFFATATHGWVATAIRRGTDSSFTDVELLVTTDGGQTLQPLTLPTSVGTVNTSFGTDTIETSRVLTMHWSDTMHGHLGAVALVAERTSSMSGTGMPSTSQTIREYRVIDYLTDDGGATWSVSNLGTIDAVGFPPPPIPSDGDFAAGAMSSFYEGWLVGAAGVVFVYDAPCSGGDCVPGYSCDGNQRCVPPTPTEPGVDPGTDPGDPNTGNPPQNTNEPGVLREVDGCSCDTGGHRGWFGALGLAWLWTVRRRRK